jgi:hypothetical protein
MPMQQVEFEFPDPDSPATLEVEVSQPSERTKLEIEDAVGRETVKSPKVKKVIKEDDLEIEVIDDTPPKDRGKKPSEPPEEVTDEELQSYSDKVRNRIKHFSKGYHDERRAKEQLLREREALEAYAKQLIEENKSLKGSVDKGHNALVLSAKKQVLGEVEAAKTRYKEAYESGKTEEIVAAQEALNAAQIRLDKVSNLKPRTEAPLQTGPDNVKQQQIAPVAPQQVARDVKAEAWRADNPWFGSDDEMTAYALGYHSKLVKEGVDPRSDDYYEKVNSRMRKMFPDQFDDEDLVEEVKPVKVSKSANVVAPATRSKAPIKVRLTDSQIELATRLGISLQDYAKHQAALMRKQ